MARWVTQLLDSLLKEGIEPSRYRNTLWISHLSNDDLLQLKKAHPDFRWKVRVGTDLWLGARTSLTATAEVMDRHQLSARERVGYRQSAPGKGWLLVAAGGTSQGIGLEVPKSGFKSLVKVILQLAGWSPSPYSWNGRALSLVEPPHMHNTLLFIKKGVPPEIGEEIGLNVRFTTTTFDEIVFE